MMCLCQNLTCKTKSVAFPRNYGSRRSSMLTNSIPKRGLKNGEYKNSLTTVRRFKITSRIFIFHEQFPNKIKLI